jgi:Putative beta-barrel porin-2, OmpL-like. bbp2/Carboxypeptidase regulatory-like domain
MVSMKRKLICKQILMAGVVFPALILLGVPTQAQKTSGAPPGMEVDGGSPFSGSHGPKTFGGRPNVEDKPAESSTPGEVRGVTRYANGLPMPGAEVVILNGDVDIDRTIVSGSDGTFAFKNLKPGEYQVSAKKDGFGLSPTTKVAVAWGKIVTVNVPLGPSSAVTPVNTSSELVRTYSQSSQSTYRMQPTSLHLTPAQPSAVDPAPAVNDTATDAPKASAPSAEQPMPAAVMDEITAMKKRIEELEAEVKGHIATEQPSTPAAAAPAVTQEAAPAQAAASPKLEPGQYLSTAGTPTYYKGDTDLATHPDGWEPFSYADWTWMNANGRQKDSPWSTKYFTPEFRADVHYMDDFNHPRDNSMGGSTESFRSNEWQLEQLSLGGDLHFGHVRGRILTMFGLFATTTPRNDASTSRGQWDLRNAYRYFSEGWGGYHFDNVGHGLNIDAGIFVSYIGLFSYYNFDNWTYQPSYVSSNTPWFFNGLRIQYFPTAKLKIEPWIINGWQSYARTNSKPGLGGQILWRPKPWLSLVFNNYGMGTDSLGNPGRSRIHTDDSVEIREYNKPDKFLDMMAMSFTADAGCEYGGNVSCTGKGGNPKQSFLGWMAYQRFQFAHDHYGITLGGGYLNNPGRYLTLLPPINGADAISGSPYFTANPGDKYHAYDATATFDYMPSQWLTFRTEMGYRHADVPYWSGRGGITPPNGNNAFLNTANPAAYVCTNGTFSDISTFAPSGSGFFNSSSVTPLGDNGGPAGTRVNVPGTVDNACAIQNGGLNSGWHAWAPDLRHSQIVATFAILTRF